MGRSRVRRAQALRPAALVPLPCLPGGSGTGTHIFKSGGSGTAAALKISKPGGTGGKLAARVPPLPPYIRNAFLKNEEGIYKI